MTMVLRLSASDTLFQWSFDLFKLYWCFLCSVLCLSGSIICLIFLATRYLNVPCIFVSKYLIAFSVSIIFSLI